MTALIGGSMLLIAGSAIALVFGWISAEANLIWISIGASVGAGILLALGYSRSKQEIRGGGRRSASTSAKGES